MLDHVVGFLVRHLPAVYQLAGGGAELVDRSDPAAPRTTRIVAPFALGDPLLTAASLVNEDLVIMVPSSRFPAPPDRDASNDLDDDYRLAAAVVCFPAHWSLKEKFSQGLSGGSDYSTYCTVTGEPKGAAPPPAPFPLPPRACHCPTRAAGLGWLL